MPGPFLTLTDAHSSLVIPLAISWSQGAVTRHPEAARYPATQTAQTRLTLGLWLQESRDTGERHNYTFQNNEKRWQCLN